MATRKKAAKKVKRMPVEKMHKMHERDPARPNYTRGGKWIGPEK